MNNKAHFVSTSDAARYLGCTIRHIQRLCTKNKLAGRKKDERWQVRRTSVVRYERIIAN